jgi:hypothetical protein
MKALPESRITNPTLVISKPPVLAGVFHTTCPVRSCVFALIYNNSPPVAALRATSRDQHLPDEEKGTSNCLIRTVEWVTY